MPSLLLDTQSLLAWAAMLSSTFSRALHKQMVIWYFGKTYNDVWSSFVRARFGSRLLEEVWEITDNFVFTNDLEQTISPSLYHPGWVTASPLVVNSFSVTYIHQVYTLDGSLPRLSIKLSPDTLRIIHNSIISLESLVCKVFGSIFLWSVYLQIQAMLFEIIVSVSPLAQSPVCFGVFAAWRLGVDYTDLVVVRVSFPILLPEFTAHVQDWICDQW